MLNFTENMKRISYLTDRTLVHVQAENYQKAREDLDNIHVHTTDAQQQIIELEFAKAQGGAPAEDFGS